MEHALGDSWESNSGTTLGAALVSNHPHQVPAQTGAQLLAVAATHTGNPGPVQSQVSKIFLSFE